MVMTHLVRVWIILALVFLRVHAICTALLISSYLKLSRNYLIPLKLDTCT